MAAETMRALVPGQLELDTFEGQPWIGVVPFGMARVYPRGTFSVPWLSRFLEMNVRTYVTLGGKPGGFFFSLDAANSVAEAPARRPFPTPSCHPHRPERGPPAPNQTTTHTLPPPRPPPDVSAP